ncbi:MAG: hypothetical protein HYY84_00730 [Deltaproteobacteria bacterium]|nr:hypothetical protein [Deltaproteobacteria bacterium]
MRVLLTCLKETQAWVYAAVVVTSTTVAYFALGIGGVDLNIPFDYNWDTIALSAAVKGLADEPWYLHNSFLGMPGGFDACDYPTPDNFHFLVLKILVNLLPNFSIAINTYYLMTFPLASMTSLLVFRHFRIPFGPAIVGSLLYPFLQYHFRHGVQHLFLSAYFIVPLMVMVALWTASARPPLFDGATAERWRPRLAAPRARSVAALLLCFSFSGFGVYYAMFAAFIILVAGAYGGAVHRSPRGFVSAGVLVASLCAGLFLNLAPAVLQRAKHGPNPDAVIRTIVDAEKWGLRITPMLLPISEHRIAALGKLRDKYNESVRPAGENDWCALGLFGTAGFLLLLWRLFGRRNDNTDEHDGILSPLSVLNGAALLLGTIGGLSGLFALLVSTSIRSYARISIFIAFFAFFSVTIVLAKIWSRYVKTRRQAIRGAVGLAVCTILGLLDQTTPASKLKQDALKAEYYQDADFIRRIEASVPPGSKIAQLPYFPYPEGNYVHRMADYEHFKPYLHSKALRWSYGAMRGRATDRWQRETFAKPPRELVSLVIGAGFSGIYIDRLGFGDQAIALVSNLQVILGETPLESGNRRRVFFPLHRFAERMRAERSQPSNPSGP